MEKAAEEILSEVRKLAKEMRRRADIIEKKCIELEQLFENGKVEVNELFNQSEEIPFDEASFDEAQSEETPSDKNRPDGNPAPAAVIDVMTEREPWRKDVPGTEVRDIRSAISLNDRILFIKTLFAGNAEAFQTCLDRLNEMDSFDDAADYLITCFPKWNFESDTVYRFMMAVRRKIR